MTLMRGDEVVATVGQVLQDDFGISVSQRALRFPTVVGNVAEGVDRAIQAVGLYNQKFHVLGELNKNIACQTTKATAELGYIPHIVLREGMKRLPEVARRRAR